MTKQISASILSADMARLGEDITAVLKAGVDLIHFDVMDNHFVPNLTMGPFICQALRNYGITAPLDVHLMIEPVDAIIPAFIKAGANCITFHAPATPNVQATIDLIKQNGCQVGIAINPDEPLDTLFTVIDQLDMVLLMSVFPGFAGQKFIPEVLTKIQTVRKLIDEKQLKTKIAVDGGVNLSTIKKIAEAGVDIFVAGSAIFGTENYSETVQAMRRELSK